MLATLDYLAVMAMITGSIVMMTSVFRNDHSWRAARWGVLGIVGYIVIEVIGVLLYG